MRSERIEKLERRRSNLIDMGAGGTIGREDLRAKLAEADEERDPCAARSARQPGGAGEDAPRAGAGTLRRRARHGPPPPSARGAQDRLKCPRDDGTRRRGGQRPHHRHLRRRPQRDPARVMGSGEGRCPRGRVETQQAVAGTAQGRCKCGTSSPGDAISTGTPGAVRISPGDVAECRIGGFGPLANPVGR